MSEAESLSAIDLSALLSSRVCHDLINPVGAISSGLEMIDDETSDAAMREMADALVRDGTKKALALLSFARLAYGVAGGYGAEIKLEDAQAVIEAVFDTTKAELDWRVANAMAAKNRVKILLILANAAQESIPRGGNVTITDIDDGYRLIVEGERMFLNEDFIHAIAGKIDDMKPKMAPAYIAHCLAQEEAGRLLIEKTDSEIIMEARFAS